MIERRRYRRYELTPPLPGRAFTDGVGQFAARLLDVSEDGAQMALLIDGSDSWAPLLTGGEQAITGVFARPEAAPWKFVMVHTRIKEFPLDSGEPTCIIAGRFVSVPTFTVADMERLVAQHAAIHQ